MVPTLSSQKTSELLAVTFQHPLILLLSKDTLIISKYGIGNLVVFKPFPNSSFDHLKYTGNKITDIPHAIKAMVVRELKSEHDRYAVALLVKEMVRTYHGQF